MSGIGLFRDGLLKGHIKHKRRQLRLFSFRETRQRDQSHIRDAILLLPFSMLY
jgi:hypothetical protein